MAKVEMLESFKTGHPEIDADHMRLVDVINDINDALEDGSFEECRRLFDSFIDVARDHFTREEAILHGTGFPRVAAHSLYHRRLLQRAHSVQAMCTEMSSEDEIRECFEKLVSFFIDDIVRGDLDFKSFLHETGVIDPQIE